METRWSGAGVFVDVENLFRHVAYPPAPASAEVLHPRPSPEDVALGCRRLLNRLIAWAGAGPAMEGSTPVVALVGKKHDKVMVAVRDFPDGTIRYAGQLHNAADAQLLSMLFERAGAGRFRRWIVGTADGDVIKGFQVAADLLIGARREDSKAAPEAQPEFFVVTPPAHGEVQKRMRPGRDLSGPISGDHVRALTKLKVPGAPTHG